MQKRATNETLDEILRRRDLNHKRNRYCRRSSGNRASFLFYASVPENGNMAAVSYGALLSVTVTVLLALVYLLFDPPDNPP
jgi:hypothetical protein